MDSVSIIDSIAQIIIPLGVCVVLPVLVVWLVSRSRKNDIDRRTEVMLKAIEHGQEIDPEAFSSKGKGRRTIKMALLGKLQSGIILFLVGAGMLIAAPFVEENTALYIVGGILVALGAGFLMSELQGKGNEVFHSEPFRPEVKDRVGGEFRRLLWSPSFLCSLGVDQGLEGVAHGLAPLVEGCLYHCLEHGFITSEAGASVAYQTDYRRLDLRRRVECPFAYRKQIFYVVPCLEQDRKYTVGLCAGLFRYPFRYLLLYHAHYLRH